MSFTYVGLVFDCINKIHIEKTKLKKPNISRDEILRNNLTLFMRKYTLK